MQRIESKIFGKVQGVFFRDFAFSNAQKLGLSGIVRNMSDGSVVVVAEGEKVQLQKFLVLLEKGAPRSKVEKVETKWTIGTGRFFGFQVVE